MKTAKIKKAHKKASELHHGQKRKGGDEPPYITHLEAVADILSEYTDDEDVIVAGLLHDSVEDTDYTFEEMENEFGKRVKDIVKGVTIPESIGKTTWTNDRRSYIENLKKAPYESALVSAADKLHNFQSILQNFESDTDGFKASFRGSIEDRKRVYGAIVDVISSKLGDHKLVVELKNTFEDYKNFLDKL